MLDIVQPLSLNYDIRIMGVTKRTSFGAKENRLADLAKALGHPARIAILERGERLPPAIPNLLDELNIRGWLHQLSTVSMAANIRHSEKTDV